MKPSSRSPLLLLVLICGLPPAAMASGDWEGPYLGANAGIVFGSNRENSTLVEGGSFYEATQFSPSALDLSGAGGTFGPEAGYRWQFGKFVIGGAVDVSHAWFDSNSATSGTDARGGPFNIGQKSSLDWLGTLRGSVGYAPNSSWLLYASGGLAAGEGFLGF